MLEGLLGLFRVVRLVLLLHCCRIFAALQGKLRLHPGTARECGSK